MNIALYTYDEQADALYVLLAPDHDAAITQTVELGDRLHADLNSTGEVIGVEILYPTQSEVDLAPLRERFGLEIHLPFSFAA